MESTLDSGLKLTQWSWGGRGPAGIIILFTEESLPSHTLAFDEFQLGDIAFHLPLLIDLVRSAFTAPLSFSVPEAKDWSSATPLFVA